MRTLSLHELSKCSDLELNVLYEICAQQIQNAAPLESPWLGASITATRIDRLRSMLPCDVKRAHA